MKRIFPLALFLAMTPGAAPAATVDLHVVGDVIHVQAGLAVSVSAIVSNSSAQTIHLNGLSASIPDQFAGEDLLDQFATYVPRALGPGETWEGPILLLTVAANVPAQIAVAELALTGGDHAWDTQTIAQTWFTIDDSTAVAGAPDNPSRPGLRVGPNPFRATLGIDFTTPSSGGFNISVFDVSGHLVRTIQDGQFDTGPQRVTWDGRNDNGTPVGPGVYFIRVRTGDLVLKTKVVKLP